MEVLMFIWRDVWGECMTWGRGARTADGRGREYELEGTLVGEARMTDSGGGEDELEGTFVGGAMMADGKGREDELEGTEAVCGGERRVGGVGWKEDGERREGSASGSVGEVLEEGRRSGCEDRRWSFMKFNEGYMEWIEDAIAGAIPEAVSLWIRHIPDKSTGDRAMVDLRVVSWD
jgi:hypothetical protein